MILLMMIIGYLVTATTEYLLHRYYLHGNTEHSHTTNHHKNFNGAETFENDLMGIKDIASNPTYIFMTSLPAFILTLFLLFSVGFNAFWIYITALVYDFWLENVHYLFHSPRHTKFEKSEMFMQLKEHHRIHHEKYKVNYGIGSTLIDHILRTKLK